MQSRSSWFHKPLSPSMGHFRFSITAKVCVLAIFLTLLTTISIDLVHYNANEEAFTNAITQAQAQEAKLLVSYLSSHITELRQDIQFLAGTPSIQGVIRAHQHGGIDPFDQSTSILWKDRLAMIFQELLKAKPNYSQIRYIGAHEGGKELIRVERNQDNRIIRTLEERLHPKGQTSYFQETSRLEARQVYLSEINLNREHGQVTHPHTPMIRAAVPIYDSQERFFGIVIIHMNYGSILKGARQHILEHEVIYIVNAEGDYLLHPSDHRSFGFDLGRRHRIQEQYPALESIIFGSPKHAHFHQENEQGDHKVYFIKAFHNPENPRHYLGIAIVDDYQELMQESMLLRNRSLIFSAVFMLIAIGIAIFFSRRLTAPLNQVIQGIEDYSNGKIEITLPTDKKDETGVLARAFNELIERVSRTVNALQASEELSMQQLLRISESEKQIQAIIDLMGDGLLTINAEGIIQSVNPAVCQMFGYEKEALIGKDVKMLMPKSYYDRHDQYLRSYIKTGIAHIQGSRREMEAKHQDGHLFPIELSVSQSEVAGAPLFIATLHDITERKKAEQIQQDTQHNLEAERNKLSQQLSINLGVIANSIASNRRTQELLEESQRQEERLRESEQRAQQSSISKSEFLANISHELRSPLNSLLLLSRSLAQNQEGNLTKEQIEFSEIIYSAGTELLNLINDILDLSKIESGVQELHMTPVPTTHFGQYIYQSFKHQTINKGLELHIEESTTLPDFISTDVHRLEQVLKNFMSNALKFTKRGSITFKVLRPTAEQLQQFSPHLSLEDSVVFSVVDTGIGIPHDKQKLIFEAFQQADGSTSRTYGGTGLGLSISTQISEMLGGGVGLVSQEGQGSTFSVFLPEGMIKAPTNATPSSTTEVRSPSPNTLSLSHGLASKTILIVDDQERNIYSLAHTLKQQGIHSIQADSAQEAFTLLEKHEEIDCVLMDIMMPEIDGYEAMQMIRKQGPRPNIPIIALTAKAMKEDRQKCLDAGANDYLSKPINLKQLLSKMESSLSSTSGVF